MIVTAALAWYDERLEDLERAVRSLPVVADRLVAVDGGYVRFPGAQPTSPPDQAALIMDVAKEVGIQAEVHVRDTLWKGQVEKRNFLIQQAAIGSDWVVGVDADHVFHGIRYTTRHELQRLLKTDVYALDVDFYTPINFERPLEHTSAGEWHRDMAGEHLWVPAFCRVTEEMRVEKFHWWYSGLINGKRYWLWGGQKEYPHARASRLDAPFMVEHRCHFRDDKHIQANKEFCEDRIAIVRKTGQEDHVD